MPDYDNIAVVSGSW